MSSLIGVDIDGVLSDIAGHLVAFVNERFGYSLSSSDLTSEDVETCTDVSAEQLKEIFSSPAFFQTLPLIAGADASLEHLVRAGWKVVIMTDRFWYQEIQKDTLKWLRANRIPFESVHFVKKTEKAQTARELGIEVFVEDQRSNANALAQVCSRVFLIDRTYNQGPTDESVTRVTNIDEVLEHFRSNSCKAVTTSLGTR
jgi:uncharacterized HAD superfamily protein